MILIIFITEGIIMNSKFYALFLILGLLFLVSCGLSGQVMQNDSAQVETEEETLSPTSTKEPTAAPEPSVIISLGPGKFGGALYLQVVKGDYQLSTGATLWEGSAVDVEEDWLTFWEGLAIDVVDGEIELKGTTYNEGTKLIVDNQGQLIER